MIDYTHTTHPRSRSIKIHITRTGQVKVTTPPRTSKSHIESFLTAQQGWIKKTQQRIKQHTTLSENEADVYIFGKKYLKKITSNQLELPGVIIQEQSVVINAGQTTTTPRQHLERFLKNTATKYIIPRTNQLAQKMKCDFGTITLRQQKTRWGSCSSSGNLNFNWRLVHAPTAVIDYVIIHELAHRKHMNHSPAFWNLVKTFDPAYAVHKGWLKRHGMAVG